MKSKRLLYSTLLILVMMAVSLVLIACSGKSKAKEPAFPSTEFVSSTELYSLYVPTGWSTAEVIPGAILVIANSEAGLENYRNGEAFESGELALNVGFLPLAFLKEKELSHLGIQFGASPDVFLQSLLPMFLAGEKPAKEVVAETTLVSLSDDRDAGMLTFPEQESDRLILVFPAGKDVFAFVSAATSPGGLREFQETIYAIAAGIHYNGSQKALYSKLYGD